MKITKRKNNVLIETTNTSHGMLEQGGLCGQIIAYPLAAVIQATGMTRAEISSADPNDPVPSRQHCSIRQICDREIVGMVIRRGTLIQ